MRLYTIPEVSKMLRVHPVTVRRYIQDQKINHLKVGKSVRFAQEHVDDFLKDCTVERKANGGENAL